VGGGVLCCEKQERGKGERERGGVKDRTGREIWEGKGREWKDGGAKGALGSLVRSFWFGPLVVFFYFFFLLLLHPPSVTGNAVRSFSFVSFSLLCFPLLLSSLAGGVWRSEWMIWFLEFLFFHGVFLLPSGVSVPPNPGERGRTRGGWWIGGQDKGREGKWRGRVARGDVYRSGHAGVKEKA
jgi:hypothetical protein